MCFWTCFFDRGNLIFDQKVGEIVVFRCYSVRCDGSSEKFDLGDIEVAFFDFEFQSGVADAFEDCSDVLDELFRCVSGNPDLVHILGTLVCFDDGVEVFPHEARKG